MKTSSLKRIANKYTQTSLILRILIGMAIGVVLALTVPEFTGIKILGDLFVGALKAIDLLLVCLLIMSSLAQTKEGHNGNMKTVVILYMFSTVMGAIVAVAGSLLFPLKITLADAVQQEAPKGVVEVLENLLLKIVANPIDALVNANYLGVLAWAVILGIVLKLEGILMCLPLIVGLIYSEKSAYSAGGQSDCCNRRLFICKYRFNGRWL